METRKKKIYLYGGLFIVLIGAMVFLTIRFAPVITGLVGNPDEFRKFIDSYGALSILVYIAFQVLQVVIAAIPGEFVQIAGGYIFGTFWGTIYSIVGILLGACIAFFLARFLGSKIVNALISEKSIEKFKFIVNDKKAEVVIFMIFLIPGLPKDILVYIAGLSPVKPLRFFMLYFLARLPGLIGSSLIGTNIQQKNYTLSIIISIVAAILFLAGFFFKDFIMSRLKGQNKETDHTP